LKRDLHVSCVQKFSFCTKFTVKNASKVTFIKNSQLMLLGKLSLFVAKLMQNTEIEEYFGVQKLVHIVTSGL